MKRQFKMGINPKKSKDSFDSTEKTDILTKKHSRFGSLLKNDRLGSLRKFSISDLTSPANMKSYASLDYRTVINEDGTVSNKGIGWDRKESKSTTKMPKSLKKLTSRKNMLSILL